jgi:hypothetical protein
MFRHVVMFRWNEGVDDTHVAELGRGLDELGRTMAGVVAYHHGPDAGVNQSNFDYVVVGDFAGVDDYIAYRDHPEHQALIARLIAGYVADRSAVQYELTG